MAMAMQARHGKTTTVFHDRRQGRGGQTNEERNLLEEYESEKEPKLPPSEWDNAT
jgi:hypothetical protein